MGLRTQLELAGMDRAAALPPLRVEGVVDLTTGWELGASSSGQEALRPTHTVREGGVTVVRRMWSSDEKAPDLSRAIYDVSKCLNDFVRLAAAGSDQIAAFATSWGPLNVCAAHLRAKSHDEECDRLGPVEGNLIETWRRYSKRLSDLMRLAAHLGQGQIPARGLWESAGFPSGPQSTVDQGWALLALIINAMLIDDQARGFDPTLVLQRNPRGPGLWMVARGHGLTTILALGLAAAVMANAGVCVCHVCDRPFTPSRRRRTLRGSRPERSYCGDPQCLREAEKLRDQDRRDRQRAGAGGG